MNSHHPQEQEYWEATVEVETPDGQKLQLKTHLLRIYPTTFNGYDAYMDIPEISGTPKFTKVYFSKLNIVWEVIVGPRKAPTSGDFRGDYSSNNPPSWIFGLKKIE